MLLIGMPPGIFIRVYSELEKEYRVIDYWWESQRERDH
jgi:hypothetical protein